MEKFVSISHYSVCDVLLSLHFILLGVFDIRHHVLLRTVPAHTSSINSIVLNEIEGYFVTGSSEGEIKVRLQINSNSYNLYMICRSGI